jgi:2-hydroxy-6-oxonona-2,4-dienedioate hydrolase
MSSTTSNSDWPQRRGQAQREIDRVAALGERLQTESPEGRMVWRRWSGTEQRAAEQISGESGAREPLVLLHGGYGSWMHWIRNVEVLSQTYCVYCADLPGLGESATVPAPYDANSLGSMIASHLRTLLGPDERCHVVGFSFGGVLSGPTVVELGPQALSLTLVGSNGMGLVRPPTDGMRKVSADAAVDEAVATHRRNLELLMFADPEAIDDLAIHMQMLNVANGRTRSRPISRTSALRDALKVIEVPAAGIWGELDATSLGQLEPRRALLDELCPGARWHTVAGAGHWVAYEAPHDFNLALLQVLEEM